MGLNFLDSVALGIGQSGASRGLVGMMAFAGTGMIMYGVYKLATRSLGLDTDPKENTLNGNMLFDKEADDIVDVPETTVDSEESGTVSDAVVETVKSIGWIFGGMLLKGIVSTIKTFTINRLEMMLNHAHCTIASLLGTNNYCVDIMKEASKDIYRWSNIVKEDQVQYNRGRASGIAESAAYMQNMFKGVGDDYDRYWRIR